MMQSDSMRVTVLVSTGLHPVSGRTRRADLDARAVEMALGLEAKPNVIHAGTPENSALRDYLGMGVKTLTVLTQPAGSDIVWGLTDFLRRKQPPLLLCGERTESGEASGLLPYQLAEALGYTLVANVAAIESVTNGRVEVLQALPRGQRRRLSVKLPALLTVNAAAKPARQSAFTKARDGLIETVLLSSQKDHEQGQWTLEEAKKRPKRLKIVTATTAAERFKAATAAATSSGGEVLSGVPAEQAADAIIERLKKEGVLK